MATLQSDIVLTVLQAKDIAGCYAEKLIEMEKDGEDIACCEKKLMLMVKWIVIIENYYCLNYNDNGTIASPNQTCLTLTQAEELLAKMKTLAGLG